MKKDASSYVVKTAARHSPLKALALFFLLTPGIGAQAASVMNLTEHPQVIEVRASNVVERAVIEPGRSYQTIGEVTVRWRDREAVIKFNEEYVIWPSGVFGPQRRMDYFHIY